MNEEQIDKTQEQQDLLSKRAWYGIDGCVFTAAHYLKAFLDFALGADDDREIVWISKSSSHFYATRWRADFIFVNISVLEADSLDLSLRNNRIGKLFIDSKGTFITYKPSYIKKLNSSPYDASLFGCKVKVTKGPLEDFYGTIVGYDTKQGMYKIQVRLLVSSVVNLIHSSDFLLVDHLEDNTRIIKKQEE